MVKVPSDGIIGRLIGVAAIVAAYISAFLQMISVAIDFEYMGYVMIITVVILSITSLKNPPSIRKNTILFLIPIIILGILYGVSSIMFHDNNRLVFAFCYIVLVPLSTICLSGRNRDNFIKYISYGSEVAFISLFLVSIPLAPLLNAQFSAILLNPNLLAVVTIPAFCAAMYLINMKANLGNSFHLVIIALTITYIILSRSRTGLLMIAAVAVPWGLHAFVKKESIGIFARNLCCITMAVTVIFASTVYVLPIVYNTITENNENLPVFTTKKVYSHSEFEALRKRLGDCDISIYNAIDGTLERVDRGIANDDDISTGRFEIWESAVNSLNVIGHSADSQFSIHKGTIRSNDAHNMLLSVAYQIGIGSIIPLIFVIISSCYLYIRSLFEIIKDNKNISKESIFVTTIIGAFIVLSMLSSTHTPVGSTVTMAFWCLFPLVGELSDER